jgi:hypothetical protein
MPDRRQYRNGLPHTCFLVLAMLGREATFADVRQFLLADGEDITAQQVKSALRVLCRGDAPLAERTERGGGLRHHSRYRLSEHGHAVLAED